MALKTFHKRVRVCVPSESGFVQIYTSPDNAQSLEKRLLEQSVEDGRRRLTTRKSPSSKKPVASSVSLFRKDGSPHYIGFVVKSNGSQVVTLRLNQTAAKPIRHSFSIPLYGAEHAYRLAVDRLARKLKLNNQQKTALLLAWGAFQKRFSIHEGWPPRA